MNLFSKKKPTAPQPRVEDTITNLRTNIESLDKREKHIYTKIDASKKEALMKKKKGDQKGAIFALKKMKMYEGEVNKLQGARMTLETQIASLEGAAINVEVFKAMQSGASAMKQIRGDLSAERVDDIMDEVQEEQELMNQISEAISRPAEDMYDEDELLAELDGLEDELESELSAVPQQPIKQNIAPAQPAQVPAQSVFNFPQVPSNVPTFAHEETEDEAALRELQASMMT
mmetsp:Transcript_6978/g.7323  ORF Transcript_6978/g.7323 Transcript_6978/m.7323 type:complete len:231 (+) Transcript_6978:27-719(+)